MKRGLLSLALLLTLASAAEAARPGGGGGGVITCPTDRLTFSPTTSAELHAALECADPGATITLTAGSTYAGNFVLRHKAAYDGTAEKRITIKSSGLSSLPPAERVSPSDCRIAPCRADDSHMAWLQVPSGSSNPVLATELITLSDGTTRRAASGYHLAGLKLFTNHWVNHLVRLGTAAETLVAELPSDITFDRSYFAGSAGQGTKQGLVANANNLVVTNSYFKDFKDTSNDALAIIIWNARGPFLIRNNYMEGSGENMMVGGGDPTINDPSSPDLVPSNITITGNHFFKPTVWTTETSTQKGAAFKKRWRIKNLFELKNAAEVVIDGNVFENNWIQADQHGFAIVFTPRNQSRGCPWCEVRNVTFTNNVIKNSTAGFNLLVTDDTYPSGQLRGLVIRNNLLLNVNAGAVPGTNPLDRAGRLIQILNPYPSFSNTASPTGPIDVTVDHNTAFASREDSFSAWSPTSGFVFTNNVVRHNPCALGNDCGLSGNGTAPGHGSLSVWFTPPVCGSDSVPPCGVLVAGNVFFDAGRDRTADYPSGNVFPSGTTPLYPYSFKSSCDGSNPVDLTTGKPAQSTSEPDYTLVADDGICASPVLASDGSGKIGADWDVLKVKANAAISGR